MANRILVVAGLAIAFIAGLVLGGVFDPRPIAHGPAVEADHETWVSDSLHVLNSSFPRAFPDDIQLEMGRAYGAEAMRLFVTTRGDYLAAKARCREHLPGDWVEVPVDDKSVAFVSSLRGTKQTSILIRDQLPVRYEISTEGSVFVKATKLARLDGTQVASEDLGKYLIRLQASN